MLHRGSGGLGLTLCPFLVPCTKCIQNVNVNVNGVQPGKVARMCHERGLAQGDVAPVSVTCWEHTIPSRGPTDQGLQGYRVSSLLCPRYVAVTGVAKRLIQTVSGRHW